MPPGGVVTTVHPVMLVAPGPKFAKLPADSTGISKPQFCTRFPVTTVQFGMVLVVLLVVTIVVVVVAGAHDAPTHASQQLAVLPTHTVPCFGAAHRAAPCLIAQDV